MNELEVFYRLMFHQLSIPGHIQEELFRPELGRWEMHKD